MTDAEAEFVSLLQEQISSKINDEIIKKTKKIEPTFIPWFNLNYIKDDYNRLREENKILKELINEYYNYT